MATGGVSLASRISVSLPADWVSVDLVEDPEGVGLVRRLGERLARVPEAAAAVTRAVRQAREEGALLVALWSIGLPAGTVGASLTVTVRALPGDEAPPVGPVRQSDGRHPVETVEYRLRFTPVGALATLCFSTPNVDRVDDLMPMFDAIARTVELRT